MARHKSLGELLLEMGAVDQARLYGKAQPKVEPPPPPEPSPVEARHVGLPHEREFVFSDEPAAPSRPVLLYGFHPAAGRALALMLEQAGLPCAPLDDAGLERLEPYDVVLSTTLGLRAALGSQARLQCLLVICGTPERADADDAKALGARLYLTPPHSVEQLRKAVSRLLR